MTKKFNPYTRTNQMIVDGLIFILSFAAAYLIRFEGVPPWQFSKQFLLWLPYLVAIRLICNWKSAVYRQIWRFVSLSDAIVIVRSLSIITGFLLLLRFAYPMTAPLGLRLHLPLSVIVLEFLSSTMGSLSARVVRRILYQREQKQSLSGDFRKRVVLIGAGRAGVLVCKEMVASADVQVVGFLDDDPAKKGSVINGVPVLGPTSALPRLVVEHQIDLATICIPRPSRETLKKLWALCESSAIAIKTVPTLEEILSGKVSIAAFRDIDLKELLGRETLEFSNDEPELHEAYMGKCILITGAGGSIGSEIAHQLLAQQPRSLILFDKDENGIYELHARLSSNGGSPVEIVPVVGNICFPERLRAVFDRWQPQVVFHAAAHKHVPLMEISPAEAIWNNVVGTRNLVQQSLACGVSRFVFISTDKAVRPRSIMGASKRVCEMIARRYASQGPTRFACVRFGNVMGSRGSVIPLFRRQILQGGPVTVTHPDVQRFFMTIPEAVGLVIRAGVLGSTGEVFILDMGDPVPVVNLARDLIELSGLQNGRDIKIEFTQLRPGEKITEELYDSPRETILGTKYERIWVTESGSENLPEDFDRRLKELEDAARHESVKEIHRALEQLDIGFIPEEVSLTE